MRDVVVGGVVLDVIAGILNDKVPRVVIDGERSSDSRVVLGVPEAWSFAVSVLNESSSHHF